MIVAERMFVFINGEVVVKRIKYIPDIPDINIIRNQNQKIGELTQTKLG